MLSGHQNHDLSQALQACRKGMIDIFSIEAMTNCGSNAFTATVCTQLCTGDVNHAFSTALQGSRTNHDFGVQKTIVIFNNAGVRFDIETLLFEF